MVNRVGRLGLSLLLTLAALGFLLPRPSSAADPMGKLSLSGQFGVSTYGMSAINSAIGRSAAIVAREATADLETPGRLRYGFDFMSEANYDLTKNVRVGLNYGRTSGSTKVDFVEVMEAKAEGTTIAPRVFYRVPWRPLENLSLRAFGGLLLLRNARTTISHENTNKAEQRLETLTLKGNGTGLTGGIISEYTISDRFTLGFEAGYRQMKAKYGSGSYTITKIADPGSDSDHDGINNNRDLRPDSFLWGFMQSWNPDPRDSQEPTIRKLDTDFSGLDMRIALHLYIL